MLRTRHGVAPARRGLVDDQQPHGLAVQRPAQVPLAEVTDYQTELKSMTGGRGRYAIEFSHYEAVPPQVQKHLVDSYKPRHEED